MDLCINTEVHDWACVGDDNERSIYAQNQHDILLASGCPHSKPELFEPI